MIDIKALCGKSEPTSSQRLLSDYDLEEGKQNYTKDRDLIKDFLPETREVLATIKNMEKNISQIKALKEAITQEARGDREIATNEKVQIIISKTTDMQKTINESLKEMSEQVDKAKEEYPDEPECRVVSTIHSTLIFKFKEVLISFQKSQSDYKNAMQSKIKRQIAIVKPEAGEKEIEALSKDPESAMKMVSDQISGKAHRKLQNTVRDIQNKYELILKLENSVEEVYQLTLNLNILIQTQGEKLNTIEKNLEEANDYLEKGENHLNLAKKWHQKTRYKMACIAVVLVIIAIILIVIFVK
ncbi:unnamed protein product [Moneuplotes crassus]|uniref:t-SNARE coiled-coil homology domain-containing protein n=1 Tax=Euplotes crassus TaxID=5936 RepID=A0AAD1XR68_EUPCR|nr:unnamed protein product [Moneuplotes crassus]